MEQVELPTYMDLMNPTIQALRDLGGSATNNELFEKVVELMKLTDEQLEIEHDPEKGYSTEVEYRLAWTRTYLKVFGLVENSSRGVWALTSKGRKIDNVDPKEVTRYFREQKKKNQNIIDEEEESKVEISWRDELLNTLTKMEPDAFERLIQRLLRESGFTQVQVTGRSGDGGIDGKGIMRIGGLLSFHVFFQCKRYKGSVPVGHVRDFRGAMVGRADKGLLITTGNFTKDALKEATRDGAPPLDLIDGDMLIEKLKELGLGVRTNIVEREEVLIEKDWFSSI